jgi:6-phosphofructokinase 1
MSTIKKIAVLTSGGDAPGMNAAIRSVVRTGIYCGMEVHGVFRGYQGLIEGDFRHLSARSVNNILNRGGTVLKSARSLEFREAEYRAKAIENLVEKEIQAVVVMGGDGTFKGAEKLAAESDIKVIAIPCTIDNDIPQTDFTIGFNSACETVIEAVDKIRDTAMSHDRIFFVEVMGRDTGHIAVESALSSGALMAYIPERPSHIQPLLNKLSEGKQQNKSSSIVIVAEGDELGGAQGLAEAVTKHLPHYETKVSILGHMQRGGSPSVFDRNLASRMGWAAIDFLLKDKSEGMVALQKGKMTFVPFSALEDSSKELDLLSLEIIDVLST